VQYQDTTECRYIDPSILNATQAETRTRSASNVHETVNVDLKKKQSCPGLSSRRHSFRSRLSHYTYFLRLAYAAEFPTTHILTTLRWLGGSAVRALDTRPKVPRFNAQPTNYQVTTLGKLFTPTCLCNCRCKCLVVSVDS